MQEIITDTCKELEIMALTLILKFASENLISCPTWLSLLIVNASSRNGEYL
jgi:hypothetical protein